VQLLTAVKANCEADTQASPEGVSAELLQHIQADGRFKILPELGFWECGENETSYERSELWQNEIYPKTDSAVL
jgi:hypothetical protein